MEYKSSFTVEIPNEFNLKHIFECGQAFRWTAKEDGSYDFIAFGKYVNAKVEENKLILRNSTREDYENIWRDYFDLNVDYSQIKEKLSIDETMKSAMDYGYGIRVLNQDLFETLISFIISANNQIPRIKKSVNLIARLCGEKIDDDHYAFPKADVLASQDPLEIREVCRVGFRDVRIVEASKMMADGFLENVLKCNLTTEEINKKLCEIPGVGPKVASCISLFALKRTDSFPVDVWIKRVMEELYFKKPVKKSEIATQAKKTFGSYCGYAQQYLFYYGRENKIGL